MRPFKRILLGLFSLAVFSWQFHEIYATRGFLAGFITEVIAACLIVPLVLLVFCFLNWALE